MCAGPVNAGTACGLFPPPMPPVWTVAGSARGMVQLLSPGTRMKPVYGPWLSMANG